MKSRDIFRTKQRGSALIEALVAMLVFALGVLGMLGVQIKSVADNQNATQRVVAARLADDLFERMKTNAGGVSNINTYVMGVDEWSSPNPVPSDDGRCDQNFCTPNSQAAFDRWQWRLRVVNMLPGGQATTFISPADPRQLGVMVAWPIRKTDAAVTASGTMDNTKTNFKFGWLNVDVPGGASCPADMVCHVAFSQP